MTFTPLLNPFKGKPPKMQSAKGRDAPGALLIFLKDFFSLQTWLAIGACISGILVLTLGRIALLLPFGYVGLQLGHTLLIALGLLPNPRMAGVISTKYSAQFPESDGQFGDRPASEQVVVFLIGARTNHPLGYLGPGFKEMGDYFISMNKDIEKRADEFDLLANSSWVSQERESANELLSVMYFKTSEGLHKYAHDKLHREAWNWWNKNVAKHPHLTIWHEVFVAPKGHWETIYVNSAPTLFGAANFSVKTEDGTQWVSPIVDAKKGILKSSRGRMDMTNGLDNDKYKFDPYED